MHKNPPRKPPAVAPPAVAEPACPVPAAADETGLAVVRLDPQPPFADYRAALKRAQDEARARLGEAMLLSWYDRDRDFEAPQHVSECYADSATPRVCRLCPAPRRLPQDRHRQRPFRVLFPQAGGVKGFVHAADAVLYRKFPPAF